MDHVDYGKWVEKQLFRHKETGEIINYGGVFFHTRTRKRGVLIARQDSDIFEEISHNEFHENYVRISEGHS